MLPEPPCLRCRVANRGNRQFSRKNEGGKELPQGAFSLPRRSRRPGLRPWRARARALPGLDCSAATWAMGRAGSSPASRRTSIMKSTIGRPRRLTDEQVARILAWHQQILALKSLRASLKTQRELAAELGVAPATG